MVDVMFGSREAMRLALQKREGHGATRELKRSSAGQSVYPGAIEIDAGHEPLPRGVAMQTGQQVSREIPPLCSHDLAAFAPCGRLRRGRRKPQGVSSRTMCGAGYLR
jgi:hypothetical protein